MSLADELLADLEEGGEDVEVPEAAEPEDVALELPDVTMEHDAPSDSVRSVAKLRDSEQVWGFSNRASQPGGHHQSGTKLNLVAIS